MALSGVHPLSETTLPGHSTPYEADLMSSNVTMSRKETVASGPFLMTRAGVHVWRGILDQAAYAGERQKAWIAVISRHRLPISGTCQPRVERLTTPDDR